MELRGRVAELTRLGFYDVDTSRLVEIYEAVFLQKLCPTCPKDHINAYNELKKWLRNGSETPDDMAKQKKYRFKKGLEGSHVPFPRLRLVVNAANLDENVKYMLAVPKRAAMIEEIPTEEAKPAKPKETKAKQ